jgi:23S rRNA (pseudouridine1915-N3)-methyltransferase
MRVRLIAIGRIKQGLEAGLIEDYLRRMRWQVSIQEIDIRKGLAGPALQAEETRRLLEAASKGSCIVALDERGTLPTSKEFAEKLGRLRDAGREVCFLIGGADGHTDELRKKADWVLSLSKLTFPHMLARAVLVEQLYRAEQILAGHPYHRE